MVGRLLLKSVLVPLAVLSLDVKLQRWNTQILLAASAIESLTLKVITASSLLPHLRMGTFDLGRDRFEVDR